MNDPPAHDSGSRIVVGVVGINQPVYTEIPPLAGQFWNWGLPSPSRLLHLLLLALLHAHPLPGHVDVVVLLELRHGGRTVPNARHSLSKWIRATKPYKWNNTNAQRPAVCRALYIIKPPRYFLVSLVSALPFKAGCIKFHRTDIMKPLFLSTTVASICYSIIPALGARGTNSRVIGEHFTVHLNCKVLPGGGTIGPVWTQAYDMMLWAGEALIDIGKQKDFPPGSQRYNFLNSAHEALGFYPPWGPEYTQAEPDGMLDRNKPLLDASKSELSFPQ